MFRRTKIKLEKKDKGPTDNDGQKSVKNELTEKYRQILGKKKNQESDTSSLQSNQNDSDTTTEKKTNKISLSENDKISSLIQLIKSADKKILVPQLNISTGIFTFPQLSEIGENPNNIQFLENLTSDSIDILEKTVYERITVCPQHPDSLEVNVRLYCPKCNSIDIEKLHLLEHKICGFISETKSFEIINSVLECPSCKKTIKDRKKELRIPAMWYNCLSCMEKFDDVIMKMYCRKFDHSFDTNMAGTVSIPGYILKDSQSTSSYDPSLISHIKNLLEEHKFISEENHSLKGKSGHFHNIDLIATNPNTDTLFLFILQSDNTLDESRINSKIIQVLDCNPTKTVIVGNLSEKAKSLASRYDISVIGSFEKNEVLSRLEIILTETFTTEKLESNNHQLGINELIENEIIEEEKLTTTFDEERLAEIKILEEERLKTEKIEAERLEAELQAEKQSLEQEMESSKLKFEVEMLADKQKLEEERQELEEERRDSERIKAERLAERKRLEEERKKVERIEAERLAERKQLESEILSERKRSESERQSDRKKLEEERFADQLKLKAEKQRLENERKKVEKLEAERQRLEEERKKAELLAAEKLEMEEKRKEEDRKQAAKKEKILKKLEETENQLRALKSSFDSDDEVEE